MREKMKICSYCRELIPFFAVKCKYCGERVSRPLGGQERTISREEMGGEGQQHGYELSEDIIRAYDAMRRRDDEERLRRERRARRIRLAKALALLLVVALIGWFVYSFLQGRGS